MSENEGAAGAHGGDIPLVEVLQWLARWWGLILACAFLGLLLGLAYHLSDEERFVVRIDMSIVETPLGSQSFVNEISGNFLRRQIGTRAIVEIASRTGRLSVMERDVPAGEAFRKLSLMQAAVSSLRDFLKEMVAAEYARMKERFEGSDIEADMYANLTTYRLHLQALDSGLLDPVVVTSETSRPQHLPLALLLFAGAIAGAALGAFCALAVTVWRRRSEF